MRDPANRDLAVACWTGVIILLLSVAAVALVPMGIAWLIVFVVDGFFQYQLPYWPMYGLLIFLEMLTIPFWRITLNFK